MRVIDIEVSQIEALTEISRERAKMLLDSGKTVICQVDTRVFERVESPLDFINVTNLEIMKVYGKLKFFIE